MKATLLILAVVMGQSVLAADKKPLTKEEQAKAIEKAIRKQIYKRTGELTEADLEKVTRLILHNNQLTSVKGLEKLTQLEGLFFSGNQLTKPPEGLEKLTQLTKLILHNNQDRLTSVKGLEKLTKLMYLEIQSRKRMTEVPKGLEKLTQLKQLYLNYNQLTDVSGLEKLTQLRVLVLSVNKLTNVKGLEKLTQLKQLYLYNNKLTDVKGLEKLTHLTELNLSSNPDLTKAQIAELQKALPKCKIIGNPTK